MSYCNRDEGDLHVYPTNEGYVCISCLFTKSNYTCKTRKELLEHLHMHKRARHKVPDRAFVRLQKEIGETAEKELVEIAKSEDPNEYMQQILTSQEFLQEVKALKKEDNYPSNIDEPKETLDEMEDNINKLRKSKKPVFLVRRVRWSFLEHWTNELHIRKTMNKPSRVFYKIADIIGRRKSHDLKYFKTREQSAEKEEN